jgi:hypothetical protein
MMAVARTGGLLVGVVAHSDCACAKRRASSMHGSDPIRSTVGDAVEPGATRPEQRVVLTDRGLSIDPGTRLGCTIRARLPLPGSDEGSGYSSSSHDLAATVCRFAYRQLPAT